MDARISTSRGIARAEAAAKPLRGKVVFLTGASAGIGAELAREFARRGANLALMARRPEKLQQVRAACENLGASVVVFRGDVTNSLEVEAAVETARRELGCIDYAIANAGFGVTGAFEKLTNDDYRRQFDTNIYGVLRTLRASLPAIRESRGSLTIIGSISGYVSTPGDSPYSMSKAAMRALADSLYLEYKPHGVAVTLICPGFVASEIRLIDNTGKVKEGAKDSMPKWIVMDTDKAAREIADAIVARRREAIITGHGKVIVFLRRFFPRFWFWFLSKFNPRERGFGKPLEKK